MDNEHIYIYIYIYCYDLNLDPLCDYIARVRTRLLECSLTQHKSQSHSPDPLTFFGKEKKGTQTRNLSIIGNKL